MATVENVSQSPIVLRVNGAFVRIEAGVKLVVDDIKSFAKAVQFYVDAGELALEGFGKSASKQVQPAKSKPEEATGSHDEKPANSANGEPEEEAKE